MPNPRPVTPSRTCQISVQSVNGPIKPVKVYKGSTQQPSPASLSGHQATAVTELPDSCPRVISAKSSVPGGHWDGTKELQPSPPIACLLVHSAVQRASIESGASHVLTSTRSLSSSS